MTFSIHITVLTYALSYHHIHQAISVLLHTIANQYFYLNSSSSISALTMPPSPVIHQPIASSSGMPWLSPNYRVMLCLLFQLHSFSMHVIVHSLTHLFFFFQSITAIFINKILIKQYLFIFKSLNSVIFSFISECWDCVRPLLHSSMRFHLEILFFLGTLLRFIVIDSSQCTLFFNSF